MIGGRDPAHEGVGREQHDEAEAHDAPGGSTRAKPNTGSDDPSEDHPTPIATREPTSFLDVSICCTSLSPSQVWSVPHTRIQGLRAHVPTIHSIDMSPPRNIGVGPARNSNCGRARRNCRRTAAQSSSGDDYLLKAHFTTSRAKFVALIWRPLAYMSFAAAVIHTLRPSSGHSGPHLRVRVRAARPRTARSRDRSHHPAHGLGRRVAGLLVLGVRDLAQQPGAHGGRALGEVEAAHDPHPVGEPDLAGAAPRHRLRRRRGVATLAAGRTASRAPIRSRRSSSRRGPAVRMASLAGPLLVPVAFLATWLALVFLNA